MTAMFFPLVALLIDILIIIMFYSKENQENRETKIYSFLLLTNSIQCVLDIFIVAYAQNKGSLEIVGILQKIDIMMIIMWASWIFLYVYGVSELKRKSAIFKKISFSFSIILSLIIVFNCSYSTFMFSLIVSFICFFSFFIILIFNSL